MKKLRLIGGPDDKFTHPVQEHIKLPDCVEIPRNGGWGWNRQCIRHYYQNTGLPGIDGHIIFFYIGEEVVDIK